MKTTKILVAGIALMSALSVSAQSGRPATAPANAGQARKAEVHAQNATRKAAHAENHAEARKHGAETAQSKANAKALENANEKSALKQDLSGTTIDPRVRPEKRVDGEKAKKQDPRGKSEEKRKEK